MILETERLILHPWEEADAEECYRWDFTLSDYL